MKNLKIINSKIVILLACIALAITSCERGLTDEVSIALFPNNGDIYIDGFTGGLDYYPYDGSKADAFSVDTDTKYAGTSAMRFDVPNVGDPTGAYAGASFILGDIIEQTSGRNLTQYDALTFYAKASKSATLNEVGFGQDFGENKYQASLQNVPLTTNWVKYIIPIPDPSKLIQERGMFWYGEGPENGEGYTFWIDELQFETLGTIGQPRPVILDGQDQSTQGLIGGGDINIGGLTQIFNLATGQDISVLAAPSYYNFISSNPFVASVNEFGEVTVVGAGSNGDNTALITANIDGVEASGSLLVEATGSFNLPPTPTQSASNVISIFSDSYTNVAVDYYNGFFNGDGQTTLGGTGEGGADVNIGGNGIINYTDLNFVGIGTFLNVPTIDASAMTHLHIDINVQEAIEAGDFIKIQLLNSVGNNETSGDVTFTNTTLIENEWVSLDIPLSDFTGLSSLTEIGLLFFVSDATISNIYVDNIYFYN